MQAILTGAEIDRSHGHPFHHRANLLDRQAVGTAWIAVAEGTRQIAFVGKSESYGKLNRRLAGWWR
jgi:hypothetical protein